MSTAEHNFKWSLGGLLICLIIALLVGCEDRFRYACQDPKNWQTQECKRPDCAINGVCPDQLNRPTDMKSEREP